MEELDLREADLCDGPDVLEMLREIGPGENGFENNAYNLAEQDFAPWLQSRIDESKGINLPSAYVPMTTYWLRWNGYPIGISKLRHRLNEALLNRGGHIGFCIRPSERRKGLAKEILSQTLKAAHRIGIEKVLLTCDIENEPSRRTIEKCGGRLKKIENGERYYWIGTRRIT